MSVRSAPALARRAFPAGDAGTALATSLPSRALEGCHTTLVNTCVVEGPVLMKSPTSSFGAPGHQGHFAPGHADGLPWDGGPKMEPFTVYEISGDATPMVFAVERRGQP